MAFYLTLYMVGCQNCSPLLGPRYNESPKIHGCVSGRGPCIAQSLDYEY